MSIAALAQQRLKRLIVGFLEEQPNQSVAGGDARALITVMEKDVELMAEVNKCLDQMGGKNETSRKYKLRAAINDNARIEFVSYTIRIKRREPKPKPTDRLDELLVQHAVTSN